MCGRKLDRDPCTEEGREDHEKTPLEGLPRRGDIDRVRFLSRGHSRNLLSTERVNQA